MLSPTTPPACSIHETVFQRYLPDPHQLRSHKVCASSVNCCTIPGCAFNRRSTVRGLAIGAFYAFVPFPWQMLLAAITAVWLRFNLPVAVAMVWILPADHGADRLRGLPPG